MVGKYPSMIKLFSEYNSLEQDKSKKLLEPLKFNFKIGKDRINI